MSRSPSVKDIRDIFANESAKNSTTKKHCDQEPSPIRDNQNNEHVNNKKPTVNTIKFNKFHDKELQKTENHKDLFSRRSIIRSRIDQFNLEPINTLPASRGSQNFHSLRKTKAGTSKNARSFLNDGEQLTMNNFDSCNKVMNNLQTKPIIPPRNTKSCGPEDNNLVEMKSNIVPQKNFPLIGAKPKYINKIKPHPNLSQELQKKINIFNNEAVNRNRISTLKGELTSSNDRIKNEKVYDIIENSKSKFTKDLKSTSGEISKDDVYDIVENINRKVMNHEFETASKGNVYETIINLNSKINNNKFIPPSNISSAHEAKKSNLKPILKPVEKEMYDVIQNSNTLEISKNYDKILMEDPSQHVYETVCEKNTRPISDSSNEDGQYIDIIDDPRGADDDSSDEELATDYDVIQNLNVTKITVERRYKVPDNTTDDSTFNLKRETYYDHNLNPRIERISRSPNVLQACEFSKVKKSLLIIQELLQTELVYFKGLLKVYENYIVYFKESSTMSTENICKVFGNFEDIYRQQIEFYGELVGCNSNVDQIAEVFLKNEKLFNMYEKYIVNKHISNKYTTGECFDVIKARDKVLGNKLDLESYLLTPVQRLPRYRLLLENLQEALRIENIPNLKLAKAITHLLGLIEGTNLHADIIQGIQNSPIDLSIRGKLLMTNDCYVKNNGKKYRSTVILFDNIIIFTRKSESNYIYKNSIHLSDLYIRSIAEDVTSFQLQNFTEFRQKNDSKYVFDLEVADPKIKQEWVSKIELLLWTQFAAHKGKRCE